MRVLILPVLILAACSASDDSSPSEKYGSQEKQPAKPARKEPDYIVVDHILIAFNGAPRIRDVTRSLADAQKLAYDLLKQVKNGGDWDALKKEYSNDSGPGVYGMTNLGAPGRPGVRPRDGMVPAFGDVGFQLAVGEIGIADYDPDKSPFGYHIIKRTK